VAFPRLRRGFDSLHPLHAFNADKSNASVSFQAVSEVNLQRKLPTFPTSFKVVRMITWNGWVNHLRLNPVIPQGMHKHAVSFGTILN
jgi:hypothetical protein